jgi:hypothetical protein
LRLFITMTFQVYKNKKTGTIFLNNKSHILDKERYEEYDFIEEVEGKNWAECIQKINQKYFNKKSE